MNKDFFITISKKDFYKNIIDITEKTKKEIVPVVKANAYGHGTKEIIKMLLELSSINRVCVSYGNEANEVKKYGWKKKVIIMSPSISDIIEESQYEYFLYSFEFLEEIIKSKKKCNVHLKIDVGLHRLGFFPEEVDSLLKKILEEDNHITVIGICTHLPRVNYELTEEIKNQMSLFIEVVKKVKLFFPHILVHPFSSKCIPFVEEFSPYCDFLRLGGSIYGLINDQQKEKIDLSLTQIIEIKTKILSIKHVSKDQYVGYGTKGKTNKDTTLAITSFGYGYGLIPHFSESYGYFKKKLFPIIGTICMNNIIFDITDDNGSMEAGEYITLSSKDYSIIEAANISFRLAGGREYYFTSLLHQTIAREII